MTNNENDLFKCRIFLHPSSDELDKINNKFNLELDESFKFPIPNAVVLLAFINSFNDDVSVKNFAESYIQSSMELSKEEFNETVEEYKRIIAEEVTNNE